MASPETSVKLMAVPATVTRKLYAVSGYRWSDLLSDIGLVLGFFHKDAVRHQLHALDRCVVGTRRKSGRIEFGGKRVDHFPADHGIAFFITKADVISFLSTRFVWIEWIQSYKVWILTPGTTPFLRVILTAFSWAGIYIHRGPGDPLATGLSA